MKLPGKHIYYQKGRVALLQGDCVDVMKAMLTKERGWGGQLDAVVTDPPYGIDWLSEDWDKYDRREAEEKAEAEPLRDYGVLAGSHFIKGYTRDEAAPADDSAAGQSFGQWCLEWGTLCYNLLKPGGYILSFGGARSHHRMTCGLEDAGFQIVNEIIWIYSTGMVRGHNPEKDIDALRKAYPKLSEAQLEQVRGHNTALKPAQEPITVGRKPLPAGVTVAQHLAETGLGAFRIADSRFPNPVVARAKEAGPGKKPIMDRYPANVVVAVDDSSYADDKMLMGEATKFFYCPKPSVKEKGGKIGAQGEEYLRRKAAGEDINAHPTQKPLRLMSWLVKLVTPPGGVVLDPFLGSGTTLVSAISEGRRGIGIEQEEIFLQLAKRRLEELQ